MILHHFISVVFMSCTWVNSMLFCAEPVSSRIYVSIPREKIESLESQEYRYVPDLEVETIARAIYTAPNPMPEKHSGCKLMTSSGKTYYFSDNCVKLKAGMRKLEDK